MSSNAVRPDYASPPVIETILNVQFHRLPRMRNAHLGAFWKLLGEGWGHTTDAPPVEPVFERFGDADNWSQVPQTIKLSNSPESRIRIYSDSRNRMIQLQNGRLIYNWLGESGESYPRYEPVRSEFQSTLSRFITFIESELGDDFRPNQWEITYLNHIPRETVWQSVHDWKFFRPIGEVPQVDGLAAFESFSGEWHFVIPEKRGRLHVRWNHGRKRRDDGTPEDIVVLNLTARGALNSDSSVEEILSGLDLGRDVIVRSFMQLMSSEANEYWGLKNA